MAKGSKSHRSGLEDRKLKRILHRAGLRRLCQAAIDQLENATKLTRRKWRWLQSEWTHGMARLPLETLARINAPQNPADEDLRSRLLLTGL